MILSFLPEAQQDAHEAQDYYDSQMGGLGARFRAELEQKCRGIILQPLLRRLRPGGYRRVNLSGFPYYIAYFLRGNSIIVAAVGHAARRPHFWKHRKQR